MQCHLQRRRDGGRKSISLHVMPRMRRPSLPRNLGESWPHMQWREMAEVLKLSMASRLRMLGFGACNALKNNQAVTGLARYLGIFCVRRAEHRFGWVGVEVFRFSWDLTNKQFQVSSDWTGAEELGVCQGGWFGERIPGFQALQPLRGWQQPLRCTSMSWTCSSCYHTCRKPSWCLQSLSTLQLWWW